MEPGSEDRREFDVMDVIRTGLPPMLRSRPSRLRDSPRTIQPLSRPPKRWIVERTFGWLRRNRRLGKDYERNVQTSETLIQAAMIRLLLRWLPRGNGNLARKLLEWTPSTRERFA